MTKPIISVDGLSKSFLIGHQVQSKERYKSLRDQLGRHANEFVRKAWGMARGRQIVQGDRVEEFWALKDVSFEVDEGDVVGVVGRNGAGKSTLLKILSRITEPTRGRVTLRGRVASLLEVGTGFHPELSGRENIFLNGAVLGMTRTEIKKKFDEIVEFADVEKFLDTPVKRYSSGMYVRLAFAVAAHLEPEILVVDEVLAVGDIQFQEKCLRKMGDVAACGRTVLFVSHNMSAVRSLCQRGILMDKGGVILSASCSEVVEQYLDASGEVGTHEGEVATDNDLRVVLRRCSFADDSGRLIVELGFSCRETLVEPLFGIIVRDVYQRPIFGHNTWLDPSYKPSACSNGCMRIQLDGINLFSGVYSIDLFVGDRGCNRISHEGFARFKALGQTLPARLSSEQIGSVVVEGRYVLSPEGSV